MDTVKQMTVVPQPVELLSERARTYVLTRWTDIGASWIDALPARVAEVVANWELEVVTSLSGGRSCVLLVRMPGGEEAVLKIAVNERWSVREAIALRHWSTNGYAPRVYRNDGDALLEEKLLARSLTWHDSDLLIPAAQMLAAASNIPLLPPGIPRIDPARSMAAAARRAGRRLPERYAWKAAERAVGLLHDAPLVLCHSDLVPANLMRTASGRIKMIDPEPRLAPLSYDLSLMAYRFSEGSGFDELAEGLARAAGVPGAEVAAWGPVHAYSQYAWRAHVEDNPHAMALIRQLR
jgi:hypothetical protein